MRPLLENVWVGGAPYKEPYNMPRQALPDGLLADRLRPMQPGRIPSLPENSMTGERILPLMIDPSHWIDIDSPDDWRRAERMLESGEISFDELGFRL